MDKDKFTQILSAGLENLGLKQEEDSLESLWIYMNFLIKENNKYNLTAIDREEEIISKHFLDSLVFFALYKPEKGARLIDIGTGAGFPGLVLKIYRPDLEVILVDSLSKRVKFLNLLIEKLQLENIQAFHARAEDLADNNEYRESFSMVVSRAVASINILSEYTIPFAKKGGKIVYFKGPDFQQELVEGKKAIKILGGELVQSHRVDIPGVEGERFLLEIDKSKTTPAKYPRRPGIPKKRPL